MQAMVAQNFLVFVRIVLAAPVAVLDQAAAMQGPPVMQSLLQRVKHKPRMRRAGDAPADNPARKSIDNESDTKESQSKSRRSIFKPSGTLGGSENATKHAL